MSAATLFDTAIKANRRNWGWSSYHQVGIGQTTVSQVSIMVYRCKLNALLLFTPMLHIHGLKGYLLMLQYVDELPEGVADRESPDAPRFAYRSILNRYVRFFDPC